MQVQTATSGVQTSSADVMQAQVQEQQTVPVDMQHTQLLEQPRALVLPNAGVQVAVTSARITPNPAPLYSSAFCFVV